MPLYDDRSQEFRTCDNAGFSIDQQMFLGDVMRTMTLRGLLAFFDDMITGLDPILQVEIQDCSVSRELQRHMAGYRDRLLKFKADCALCVEVLDAGK